MTNATPPPDQELLAQKIEAVCRLAAGVAHDFNNLLTVISGNVELLQQDEKQPGPRRAELQEVADAARRAARLTNQLLAFSRQQLLQPEPVNLSTLLSAQRSSIQRMAGLKVELEMRLDAHLGTILADEAQLIQIVKHLVSNARDAMPAGGTIRITTANVTLDAEKAAHQAPMNPGDYALLSVADTGVGMDAQTQARAFEPFFTTKQSRHGTGMGLPSVYGIVKQSGGFIFCDSALGHGTVIRIYLPRAAEPPPAPTRSVPGATQGASGPPTVLIVEDEELVRALARRTLERAGYRVYESASAREAVSAARALGPALSVLLTDIIMPDMNGRDLAATIERELPQTAVILMSGFASGSEPPGVPRSSGWSFLRKPFTVEELRSRVRAVLQERTNSSHV
ncbi:MAG: ATP-binding protein [Gemmatimonadota bacterium]